VPFTFSHPAAILPIHSKWREWLSLPPLVIGSLIPDAGYYLPMPEHYKANAHTWSGALLFSLPVGIVVLLIFYWIAPEIVYLLPSPYREVLEPRVAAPMTSLGEALLAFCGLVIGVETHILWDSFTHQTGWLVERVAFLRSPFWGGAVPVFYALQVLSSVAGLCILVYVLERWTRAQMTPGWTWQKPSWRFCLWFAVLAGCVFAAILESHAVHGIENFHFHPGDSRHFALILVTSFVRDVLLALCAMSLSVKLFRFRVPQHAAS